MSFSKAYNPTLSPWYSKVTWISKKQRGFGNSFLFSISFSGVARRILILSFRNFFKIFNGLSLAGSMKFV